MELFDAHCHLGWFSDPVAAASEAEALGLGVFAVTVTPEEYERVSHLLAGATNVRVGVGLHPWYALGSDLDRPGKLVEASHWIGEVGLDFSPRRVDENPAEAQVVAFEHVCAEALEGAVLSIHSVRAASAVLDVLERTGAAARCNCIFHWFSGSTDELWRAIRLGCWFSLGERSLATKRGREYARLIPTGRLLTETDFPPREGYDGSVREVAASLERAIAGIAHARSTTSDEVRKLIAANAQTLLAER